MTPNMDIKNKIKELRAIIPIPIAEGVSLLKENKGDIQKCVDIFNEKAIDYIVSETKCNREIARSKYILEKYDINRAISSIREDLYDVNYISIVGLKRDNLLKVREWFNLEKAEGFATAMEYRYMDLVISTLSFIPTLAEIGDIINDAYLARNNIFEGYSDDDPISEYVLRHKKLDDDLVFNQNWNAYKSKTITFNEELTRHIRNCKE